MNCYYCRGKIKKKKIDHIHKWGDKIYLFSGVPAEICTQCGETYLGPAELRKMDQYVTSSTRPQKRLSIPIFAL
ncbi:MAG: hypothetical protein A3I11_00015 [Elusimicrobia bacterium RIFCSPLOWO2_02_FULL_39_32]|nr:MAG: hypothetical protein A2034_08080 [Elusimicrobia bacterium GWA2_38_7]OGR80409.1 MAG: hypothetical protein A3B80_04445 [Elusimicrobia bacterium RIFCSPHIGHO2_02_FULL_39_36]OGR93291.1 MAG: hypothetical protein A3I11_00015 [Elusimicrobia bacterium RIFCSPLOWO2_02_FULL_39_32]OGS00521.1 MAG: hypothetical protein A3G85_00415 [Elusimicrobia bacterium RIFCSPLOWO2_12_FULL_39_28]